jgi:hypothetical protein
MVYRRLAWRSQSSHTSPTGRRTCLLLPSRAMVQPRLSFLRVSCPASTLVHHQCFQRLLRLCSFPDPNPVYSVSTTCITTGRRPCLLPTSCVMGHHDCLLYAFHPDLNPRSSSPLPLFSGSPVRRCSRFYWGKLVTESTVPSITPLYGCRPCYIDTLVPVTQDRS